jgi:hypothetical protein
MNNNIISKEMDDLMREVRKDKRAFKKLQAKAQWEHISLFAVLKSWGDPRKWK